MYFWQEYHRSDTFLLVSPSRDYLMSLCFVPGDINLDYLVKMKSARFLHCKVIICLFVTNKYLWRDNFEAMQVSCFSSNSLPLILASISKYCVH